MEDNVVDRPMVNLTELARALCVEVDDETTTKVVFYLDQVACHLAYLACNKIFGQFAQLCFVFEGSFVGILQKFSRVLLGWLLTETHAENVVFD